MQYYFNGCESDREILQILKHNRAEQMKEESATPPAMGIRVEHPGFVNQLMIRNPYRTNVFENQESWAIAEQDGKQKLEIVHATFATTEALKEFQDGVLETWSGAKFIHVGTIRREEDVFAATRVAGPIPPGNPCDAHNFRREDPYDIEDDLEIICLPKPGSYVSRYPVLHQGPNTSVSKRPVISREMAEAVFKLFTKPKRKPVIETSPETALASLGAFKDNHAPAAPVSVPVPMPMLPGPALITRRIS